MSQKLSTIRGADTCHRCMPLLIRRNEGSASCAMVGISPAGSSRHTQTRPYRSSTTPVRRWAAGGTVASSPDDGTSTQRPASPNVQPWYAQTSRPSSMVPADSGASRCGHRSGATTRSPDVARQTTRSSPSRRQATGRSPMSDDSATGCQAARIAGLWMNAVMFSPIDGSWSLRHRVRAVGPDRPVGPADHTESTRLMERRLSADRRPSSARSRRCAGRRRRPSPRDHPW